MTAAAARSGATGRPAPSRPRMAGRLGWTLPAVLFLALFFVLPLVDNTINSLMTSEDGKAVFSLRHYTVLLTDRYYVAVIVRTLVVSLIATVLCILIGYPIAYYMVRHAGRLGTPLIFLLVAPLLTSIIMRTYGWQVLLARNGPVNVLLLDFGLIASPLRTLQSPVSVMIGLVHILVPFMVISIASVLQSIDRSLEDSARILGAGAVETFCRVTFPLSLNGVVTGSIIVFMLANGSFLTMLLLGNNSVVTLPLLIYQQFILLSDARFAAAMGNILLLLALICLYLQLRIIRRGGAAP